MMHHRYWCQTCRKLHVLTDERTAEVVATQEHACTRCHAPLTYLESVEAPEVQQEATQGVVAAEPELQKPPSAEEWYDAGYAPGTYEPRFAEPGWLPCWSDPSYVPKHRTAAEIAACMGIADETEQAPPVDDGEAGD